MNSALYELFTRVIEDVGEKRFEMIINHSQVKGRRLTIEGLAIRNLDAGQAIKFACRWRHNEYPRKNRPSPSGRGCSGIMLAHKNAERQGFKVNATCREGNLYVRRISDES